MKIIVTHLLLCFCLVSTLAWTENITITITASPDVRHHDMWIGFFALDGKILSPTSKMFELKEVEAGKFEGSIQQSQIKGQIHYMAVYAGGGNMYYAALRGLPTAAQISKIDFSHNGSSLEPQKQWGNPPVVKVDLEGRASEVAELNLAMVVAGLKYEESLEGIALTIFNHQLLGFLNKFTYDFAFDVHR